MKKIAIFVSGGGSNFAAIHNKIVLGYIPAIIRIVISNNVNCGAVKYAENNSIPIFIINKTRYKSLQYQESKLMDILLENKIDLICLAGYLKLIPPKIVSYYKRCILNIHPALLPKFGGKGFYGIKVHKAVLDSKVSETGATVHFVDEKYDCGPIVLQETIKIELTDNADSLAKKVLSIEHTIYPKVIKAFCEKKIFWKNNQPIIENHIED